MVEDPRTPSGQRLAGRREAAGRHVTDLGPGRIQPGGVRQLGAADDALVQVLDRCRPWRETLRRSSAGDVEFDHAGVDRPGGRDHRGSGVSGGFLIGGGHIADRPVGDPHDAVAEDPPRRIHGEQLCPATRARRARIVRPKVPSDVGHVALPSAEHLRVGLFSSLPPHCRKAPGRDRSGGVQPGRGRRILAAKRSRRLTTPQTVRPSTTGR